VHPLDGVVASPLLARQRIDLLDRGLGHYVSRATLLVRIGADVAHPEAADQGRQREPLHDEREEDHGEGEEDDEVAVWKAAACVGRERQRERHRARDGTSHPAPCHHQAPPRSYPPCSLIRAPVDRPDDVGDGEEPPRAWCLRPPRPPRGRNHRGCSPSIPTTRPRPPAAAAHQDEQNGVDDEVEDVPDEVALQTGTGRQDPRSLDAHVDTCRTVARTPDSPFASAGTPHSR
jgi:hypothetical protein